MAVLTGLAYVPLCVQAENVIRVIGDDGREYVVPLNNTANNTADNTPDNSADNTPDNSVDNISDTPPPAQLELAPAPAAHMPTEPAPAPQPEPAAAVEPPPAQEVQKTAEPLSVENLIGSLDAPLPPVKPQVESPAKIQNVPAAKPQVATFTAAPDLSAPPAMRGAGVSQAEAVDIALGYAPPARRMEVLERTYNNLPVYVVRFYEAETGAPVDVLVDVFSGRIIKP